jgi:multicomponent Na+:H+ antiporter subunit A
VLWTVLSIFALAAGAPLVVSAARRVGVGERAAGWGLALLPAGLFAYFLRQAPAVAEGAIQQTTPWVPGLGVELAFYLDGLGLLFALLITGVGALIVAYAGGYLAGHDELGRFYSQLLLFMGAMLGLTISDDLILFFVFFELTSLASYLLIGFYHGEEGSRVAARKALVVTGGGGLALLGGLLLLHQVTGTFQFSEMLAMVSSGGGHGESGNLVTSSPLYGWILALVCAGAFTKSAQFPFHFWLPAAMAGPTPVSAYLHSATMVKAGVFLLARLSPILGGTAAWAWALVPVGAFTMVMSAWLGLRFRDLKQVLAYTTVMVLGLLVMLLGIGTPGAIEAMVTFTVVHALYKGALFMMAGNIDHEAGTRDVLELGGLRGKMPLTFAGGLLAALSMAGLPPFFGFVGKEVVYEAGLGAGASGYGVLAASVLANAALFAGALVVGVKPFFGKTRGALTREPHEAPPSMWLGPVVLGAGGLVLGGMPGLVDTRVLVPASDAIQASHHSFHLGLWHGFNAALGLSLATFALGGALYYSWRTLHASRPMKRFAAALAAGPGRVFERGLYRGARGSYHVARLMQSGKLGVYLVVILGFIALLVGGAFVGRLELVAWPDGMASPRYYEVTLAVAIVAAAAVAVRARSRFVAILALSVAGYSIAMVYLFFGAPDLAMTQFAVETLTLVLLVLVLANLPRFSFEKASWKHARDGVVAGGVGAVVTLLMWSGLGRGLDRSVSRYLSENAYDLAKGHNIVNVILVDYRALDTLGEITVLTMAALGVYALMRLPPLDEESDRPEPPGAPEEAGGSGAAPDGQRGSKEQPPQAAGQNR